MSGSLSDSSSAAGSEDNDEIRRIRHAMRVAKSRQNALKLELAASQESEEHTARCHQKRCKQQQDEITKLKLKLVSREEEIQFLQKKLSEKDKILRESSQLNKLQNTAAIASLWDSLRNLESNINNRRALISEECLSLERLLGGLEQHAMRGHHMVSSRTAIGLFIKMREAIGEIRAAAGEDGEAAAGLGKLANQLDSTNKHRDTDGFRGSGSNLKNIIAEKTGATRPLAVKEPVRASGKRSTADEAYLDLCRYLEEENGRLQRSLESAQSELERAKADAEAAALIPQYRLAIVRARTQAGQLQDQLIKEQEASKWLRGQLDRAHKELQLQLCGEASFSKRNTSDSEIQRVTSSHNWNRQNHQREKRQPRHKYSSVRSNLQQRRDSGDDAVLQSNIDSSMSSFDRPRSTIEAELFSREKEVENDLESLDHEIDMLKMKLEQAALAHTQRVVSQVMSAAPADILS